MSVDVSFQKGSRVARAAIVNEFFSWRTEQTAFPELLKRKWLALRWVSLPPSASLPFFVLQTRQNLSFWQEVQAGICTTSRSLMRNAVVIT